MKRLAQVSAVLAAIVLSFGFAACSADGDTGDPTASGKYTVTVSECEAAIKGDPDTSCRGIVIGKSGSTALAKDNVKFGNDDDEVEIELFGMKAGDKVKLTLSGKSDGKIKDSTDNVIAFNPSALEITGDNVSGSAVTLTFNGTYDDSGLSYLSSSTAVAEDKATTFTVKDDGDVSFTIKRIKADKQYKFDTNNKKIVEDTATAQSTILTKIVVAVNP